MLRLLRKEKMFQIANFYIEFYGKSTTEILQYTAQFLSLGEELQIFVQIFNFSAFVI